MYECREVKGSLFCLYARQANFHTLGVATNHPQHFLKFVVLADSCFHSDMMVSLQAPAASSVSTTLLVLHAPHILTYCLQSSFLLNAHKNKLACQQILRRQM